MVRMSLVCGIVLAAASTAAAQQPVLDPRWVPVDGAPRLVDRGGVPGIAVAHGSVVAPDVMLRDGTIEFDWRGGPESFAGIEFRMQNNADYDVVYLRSDSLGRWIDAQYQGVYQGETSWQLFPEGPYTAPLPVPLAANRWLHVRVQIGGTRLRVWLGDAARPLLDVPDLQRDAANGYIGFWAQSSSRRRGAGQVEVAGLRVDPNRVPDPGRRRPPRMSRRPSARGR